MSKDPIMRKSRAVPLPSVDVKGTDPAVRAHIIRRRSEGHHVLHHQRRDVELVAFLPVLSSDLPLHAPGLDIDSEQMAIDGRRLQ
jgi:hypothetical protein